MAFESMFFDSTETLSRPVTGQKWAQLNENIMTGGYGVVNLGDPLTVAPKQNMTVTLSSGAVFISGYLGNNDAPVDLTLDAADPTNDRIDRVVIRFDNSPTERRIYPDIVKGTAVSTPTAPALTRSGDVYEMSVAQIYVIAGKSFIEATEITDERANEAVCGYTGLSNLLRGVLVNESGMVTMPNQSFIKTYNDTPLQLNTNTQPIPFGTIETDKQGEIYSSTIFRPKADGIYQFWVEMAWQQTTELTGVDVQTYIHVNGTESFPLGAKVLADENDNFVIESGFDELKAGDDVEIKALAFRSTNLPTTNFTRIRIAKLA